MEKTMVSTIIIVIAVVIVVGGLALIFYNYVYPALNSLEFEKLPSNVKQQIDTNWNKLLENIQSCNMTNMMDSDCLCGGFPNFPTTFPKDFKISFGDKKIQLFFKASIIKEAEIKNFKQSFISSDYIIRLSTEYIYDFKEITMIDEKGYLSYAGIQGYYSLIITDKFYKKDPDMVTYLTFVFLPKSEKEMFLELQKSVNSRPQCINWRPSAINKFMEFVSCANSNQVNDPCPFSVKDAVAFNVKIAGTIQATASLFYNQESVKKYDSTQKKSVTINAVVPVPCDAGLLTLQDGESVKKIVLESGKVCLKKR